MARRAGAGDKTWYAYLSAQAAVGKPAFNARDRIGRGPWQNFRGEVVAQSVGDLHGENNKLNMQTSLTERGSIIPVLAKHPTATTFSPARKRTDALFRPAKIGFAKTGRAAPRDRRWLATLTGRVCATMQRRIRGTHRIPRAGQMAAAARPICAAPAGTGCSIALPLISWPCGRGADTALRPHHFR